MPTWLVPTLKWGGIALAIISAIAVIYVQYIAATPPPEAGATTDEAPVTLYWVLLLIGMLLRSRDSPWIGGKGPPEHASSGWPHVHRPREPIGIAPFRLTLDDERLATDGEPDRRDAGSRPRSPAVKPAVRSAASRSATADCTAAIYLPEITAQLHALGVHPACLLPVEAPNPLDAYLDSIEGDR